MTDGNNGSPYRRSHRTGAGHFSPMHTSGASSGGANYFVEEAVDDVSTISSDQNLWDDFETVACSVTDLYRNPNWNIFQRTAATATQFYKNSVDSRRRGMDAGITIGRQILCKEIIHWLQTSSPSHLPFVRREEVINFVLTRATMTTANGTDANAGAAANATDLDNSSPMQTQQRQDSPSSGFNNPNEPLEIFQEALAMPATPPRQQNLASANSASNVGLTAFFVDECRRHGNGKRRRLSPDHSPYYFNPNSSDLSPDGGNGGGNFWHARPAKRSRRF